MMRSKNANGCLPMMVRPVAARRSAERSARSCSSQGQRMCASVPCLAGDLAAQGGEGAGAVEPLGLDLVDPGLLDARGPGLDLGDELRIGDNHGDVGVVNGFLTLGV